MKQQVKYAVYGALDFLSFIARSRKPMVPPKRRIFIGNGDFERIGDAFMSSLINGGNLRPDSKVLDVGSGQGRVARPLTGYLSSEGSYHGIEIVQSAVDWCKHEYRRYPNFQFIHADIFNTHYNRNGTLAVRDYEFPFADGSLDVIFFSSVLTHILADDADHYLSEVGRCLRPKGRCIATCFLLNEESINAIGQGNAALAFRHRVDEHGMTTSNDDPEDAIALEEGYLRSACAKHGLRILDIRYGNWIPRAVPYGFQDMVIAEKV